MQVDHPHDRIARLLDRRPCSRARACQDRRPICRTFFRSDDLGKSMSRYLVDRIEANDRIARCSKSSSATSCRNPFT